VPDRTMLSLLGECVTGEGGQGRDMQHAWYGTTSGTTSHRCQLGVMPLQGKQS